MRSHPKKRHDKSLPTTVVQQQQTSSPFQSDNTHDDVQEQSDHSQRLRMDDAKVQLKKAQTYGYRFGDMAVQVPMPTAQSTVQLQPMVAPQQSWKQSIIQRSPSHHSTIQRDDDETMLTRPKKNKSGTTHASQSGGTAKKKKGVSNVSPSPFKLDEHGNVVDASVDDQQDMQGGTKTSTTLSVDEIDADQQELLALQNEAASNKNASKTTLEQDYESVEHMLDDEDAQFDLADIVDTLGVTQDDQQQVLEELKNSDIEDVLLESDAMDMAEIRDFITVKGGIAGLSKEEKAHLKDWIKPISTDLEEQKAIATQNITSLQKQINATQLLLQDAQKQQHYKKHDQINNALSPDADFHVDVDETQQDVEDRYNQEIDHLVSQLNVALQLQQQYTADLRQLKTWKKQIKDKKLEVVEVSDDDLTQIANRRLAELSLDDLEELNALSAQMGVNWDDVLTEASVSDHSLDSQQDSGQDSSDQKSQSQDTVPDEVALAKTEEFLKNNGGIQLDDDDLLDALSDLEDEDFEQEYEKLLAQWLAEDADDAAMDQQDVQDNPLLPSSVVDDSLVDDTVADGQDADLLQDNPLVDDSIADVKGPSSKMATSVSIIDVSDQDSADQLNIGQYQNLADLIWELQEREDDISNPLSLQDKAAYIYNWVHMETGGDMTQLDSYSQNQLVTFIESEAMQNQQQLQGLMPDLIAWHQAIRQIKAQQMQGQISHTKSLWWMGRAQMQGLNPKFAQPKNKRFLGFKVTDATKAQLLLTTKRMGKNAAGLGANLATMADPTGIAKKAVRGAKNAYAIGKTVWHISNLNGLIDQTNDPTIKDTIRYIIQQKERKVMRRGVDTAVSVGSTTLATIGDSFKRTGRYLYKLKKGNLGDTRLMKANVIWQAVMNPNDPEHAVAVQVAREVIGPKNFQLALRRGHLGAYTLADKIKYTN